MIIRAIKIFKYILPLTKPLLVYKKTILNREGLLLQLEGDESSVGCGEIAPLSGLHQETFKEALSQLMHHVNFLMNQNISANILKFKGEFENLLRELKLYPSVRYGIEQALFNLLRDKIKNLFYKSRNKQVLINGLLLGEIDSVKENINELISEGYQSIKIKIGHNSVWDDIKYVNQINNLIKNNVSLRLDANQSWTLEEAVEFSKSIDSSRIEYIEEPLKNPKELEEYFKTTGIYFGLDESLTDVSLPSFYPPLGTKAFILKPDVLGGIEKTVSLIKFANKNNLNPVMSCSFLSGISLLTLSQLAAEYISPAIPMGLDTYKWLGEDLITPPFQAKMAKIDLSEMELMDSKIRMDSLELIHQI